MEWIIENKEWLFSGLGVVVVGGILKLMLSKKEQTPSQSQSTSVVVNVGTQPSDPQVAECKPKEVTKDSTDPKSKLNVLFIDDEKFDHVSVLKKAGWINTKRIDDVKRIDCPDVLNADVIFVDINGVGCDLCPQEQGLGVAKQIKKSYPQKYVVIYSAQQQTLSSTFKEVDDILTKTAAPIEYITILESVISDKYGI